jgi:hypothetical protein
MGGNSPGYVMLTRVGSNGASSSSVVYVDSVPNSADLYWHSVTMVPNADQGVLVFDQDWPPLPEQYWLDVSSALQTQGGWFVATALDSDTGSPPMVAFTQSGAIMWLVANDQPMMVTDDGGVIGVSGIVYNNNGSAIGMAGYVVQSWTSNLYQIGSIHQVSGVPAAFATSVAFLQGAKGVEPPPDRVKAIYDIVAPDSCPQCAGVVVRSINYRLFQGAHTYAPSKNAVIKEKLLYSYGQHPQESLGNPGQVFQDGVGTRGTGDFGLTQQFFANVPRDRDYRLLIEPCTAANTFGSPVWQNIIRATAQTVVINDDPGSTTGRTCQQ